MVPWRRTVAARALQEEDIIEQSLSRRIDDDGVRIQINTTTPSRSFPAHHPSLVPSPAAITAYTLSSPVTLRAVVTHAQEIYRDLEGPRARERGEDELVTGFMRRRPTTEQASSSNPGKIAPKPPTAAAAAGPSIPEPVRASRGRRIQQAAAGVSVHHASASTMTPVEAGAASSGTTTTTKRPAARKVHRPLKEYAAAAGEGPARIGRAERAQGSGTVQAGKRPASQHPSPRGSASTYARTTGRLARAAVAGEPTAAASRGTLGVGPPATRSGATTGRPTSAHGHASSSAMASAYPGRALPLAHSPESSIRPGPSAAFGGTFGHGPPRAPGSDASGTDATTVPHRAAGMAVPVRGQAATRSTQEQTGPSTRDGSAYAPSTYPGMPPFLAHSPESGLPTQSFAASRSVFGLGFGDVGEATASTDDDTPSARLLFVPGGFPLAFSPAVVSRTRSDDRATRQHPPPTNESVPTVDPSKTSQSPATDASTSHLAVPGASQHARPGRPLLRKNNSLGLMGTLDSMRSPSLEPTSAFAHAPPMIAKSAVDPSAHSLVGVASRLRPSHGDDPGGAAGAQVGQLPVSTESEPPRTQWSSSQGIHVPLMPLPLVTPASSPQIRQADSMPPTPEIGGPSVSRDPAAVETASTAQRPPPAITSPEEKVASVIPNESAAESSDLSELDNVPTSSVTALKNDSRSKDGWRVLVERPIAHAQATRAVRPGQRTIPAESIERARAIRTTSVATASVQALKERAALSSARGPAEQEKDVKKKPSVADESILRVPAASTADLHIETATDKGNIRKRKEPPTSIPTRPTRRGINMATVRPPTERAVRPVIPAIVGAHREFALPETMIAEVTPVRRARVSSAAASQALASPTKKRKKNSGLADTGSAMTSAAPSEDESVQARARRRSTRTRSQAPRD